MKAMEIGYSDVLNMATNERRYYLGLLVKNKQEEQKMIEEAKLKQSSGGKGTRKTRVGGEALKTRIKTGTLPME